MVIDRLEEGTPASVVGRQDELARIEALVGRIGHGDGDTLVLTGEPGAG